MSVETPGRSTSAIPPVSRCLFRPPSRSVAFPLPASWFKNPFISSAESTAGTRFGNFGVATSRAGFSFSRPSRTQYLKNDRSAANFRAIELFSSPVSCRKASAHGADLRLLLHDERRAALRARLRHRHERRRKIAIRVPRAAVEHAESSAPALSHAPALHKFAFIALRALDAHGDRPGVLALRVSRATDELPKPAVLFHQPVSVQRAFLVQRFVRLVRNSRPRHQAPRRLAIRITRASQKRAKSPAFQRHLLSAVFAVLNLVLGVFRNLFRHVLDEIAFRIPRASQEKSVPADPFQQFALPALFALFPGRNPGLVRNHLVAGLA